MPELVQSRFSSNWNTFEISVQLCRSILHAFIIIVSLKKESKKWKMHRRNKMNDVNNILVMNNIICRYKYK